MISKYVLDKDWLGYGRGSIVIVTPSHFPCMRWPAGHRDLDRRLPFAEDYKKVVVEVTTNTLTINVKS